MRIILLLTFLMASVNSYSQVVYHVTKYSNRTLNSAIKPPFKEVKVKTTISLFNNGLLVEGDRELRLKLVRKINVTEADGTPSTQWNALDSQGRQCLVMMKDYGTYSRIGIFWTEQGSGVVYHTL